MDKSAKRIFIILGTLGLLGLVFLFYTLNPSGQAFFPQCPTYKYLGIYCSGCGSQRAIHDLLHLRFRDALSHNLLLIPAVILILIELYMRIVTPHKKSILYRRTAPIVVLIVLLLFMIIRNIPKEPFTFLAP